MLLKAPGGVEETYRGLGHTGAAPLGVDPGKQSWRGVRGLLVLWAGGQSQAWGPLAGLRMRGQPREREPMEMEHQVLEQHLT